MKHSIIFVLTMLCLTIQAEAMEIKFGFYYDNEIVGLEKDLFSAKDRIEKLLNIQLKIDYRKRLPFNLPVLEYYNKPGVELEYLFRIIEQQKLSMNGSDFVFILTDKILWDLRLKDNKLSRYFPVDGYADIDNKKHALLRYKSNMGVDYLHLLLMHEWGHLLGLGHRDDICGNGVNFIMCSRHGLGRIMVETSYRNAVQNFLQK